MTWRRSSILTVLLLTACGATPASIPPGATSDAPSEPEPLVDVGDSTPQPASLPDADIASAVEQQLSWDPAVNASEVQVQVVRGIAILEGETPNLLERLRAADVAKATRGVRGVVNRVVVAAPERADRELERDVRHALAADPTTDPWEVEVEANDGLVVLSGIVDTVAERRLLLETVAGVRGVIAIDDHLDVDGSADPERSEAELEAVIEARLDSDVRVDGRHIDVSVDESHVTLVGDVGSVWERERAIELASVPGVRFVEAYLDVEWWRVDYFREGRPALSNEEVVRAVENTFSLEPRMKNADVDVVAARGVVTLSGTVPTVSAERAAIRAAWNTNGVYHVEERLDVEPAERLDDRELADEVRAALRRSPYTELAEIDVAVERGHVTLIGQVDSPVERQRAIELAGSVQGTRSVTEDIDLDGSVIALTDEELALAVTHAIEWNPSVDAEEIDVRAEEGVVILTGTVGSTRARLAAMEAAYALGAVDVLSRIRVRGAPTSALGSSQ